MRLFGMLATVVALLTVVPVEAREFRSSDIYSQDYPTVRAVMEMDRLIRVRTGGRLGITVVGQDGHDSETLTITELRNGTLDMGRVNIAVLNSTVPATVVPSLPFLFKSTAQLRRVLDGPIGEEILADMERQGLVGLCFYDAGPRSFYSVTRPIRTPADLKDMKVRVQQSNVWTTMLRALGAVPMSIPFDQAYSSLQTGAIEAADNNWPAYIASRHYNVARYVSLTEHSMAPTVLIFSKHVWDELSESDRAVIRGAARESVGHMRKLWDEIEASAPGKVEAAGGKIIADVDKKAFADALLPLYPRQMEPRLLDMVRRIQTEE
jgi:tripartite ATP-independent transporter DctP family solute receptor